MFLTEDITKLITEYPVIKQLSPKLQHALANQGYVVHAKKGAILFDIDSPVESFLMLTEGTIRVTQPGNEREIILYRMHPGEVCILSTCYLLFGNQYPARAQAETDISGIALSQPLFKQMVELSPIFCAFLFQSFASRVEGLLGLLESVTSMRLDQRLATLLLSRGPVIKMTHSQLADELGSVREVISRILIDFKAKGFIELERSTIRVIDAQSLEKISNFGDLSH